jgi:hypothetical protein
MVILNSKGKRKRRLTPFEKRVAALDLIVERSEFNIYLYCKEQMSDLCWPIEDRRVVV